IVDQPLISPAVAAFSGRTEYVPLKIWHGFNIVLLLSAITLAAGVLLYLIKKPFEFTIPRWLSFLNPQNIAMNISALVKGFSLYYTRTFQNGYLRNYLITIILFLVGVVSFKLFTDVDILFVDERWSDIGIYEILVFLLMLSAVIKTLTTTSRLSAIVSMSVVG